MPSLLIATIFLPLVGVLLVGLFSKMGRFAVRQSALVTTLVTFALACVLVANYKSGTFAQSSFPWLKSLPAVSVELSLGLDGLSVWLFALSALLMVTSVLVSWEAIEDRPATFYALLLMLETGTLGVFAARDIILFYIFFEFTLIPLFFLIGIWGSEERRYAAIKFFLYTLAGSLLTFLGLLSIVIWVYNHESQRMIFSIAELTQSLASHPMSRALQLWIFAALFAGFAIKVPLFPLHTWLPLAHVQAPTAGSVILAGVLLKIGTYGFLRFSVPMLPVATAVCVPWLLWLSVTGIIYGALVALAQTDVKRLIAYSSVSHLGFCMLGLFALNRLGTEGSVLQMVNHGLSTGGLFAVVGMMYERYHTREIRQLGGLASQTPRLALFMLVFTLASIGLPGLNGFSGEFPILLGMFQRATAEASTNWGLQFKVIAVLATFGVVLGAWYMLWLVERTFFGPLRHPERHDAHDHKPVSDLSLREVFALVPLVVFIVWIGLCPQFFLERTQPTLDELTASSVQTFADLKQPAQPIVASPPAQAIDEVTRVD